MQPFIDAFLPHDRLSASLSEGKRVNGRAFDEPRPLELQRRVFPELPGSASVRRDGSYYFGDVSTTLGLKMDNFLTVKVQVPPISGSDFGLNKKSEGATMRLGEDFEQNLNSWVDTVGLQVERILRSCLRPEAFIIKTDTLTYVWHLNVRVTCLSYSGNLVDNVLLCALLTLLDLRLPRLAWDPQRRWWREDKNGEGYKPPEAIIEAFHHIPVPVSVHEVDGIKLVDADLPESKSGCPSTLIYMVPTNKLHHSSLPKSTKFDWIRIPSPLYVSKQPEIEFQEMRQRCSRAADNVYKLLKPHA